MIGRTATSRCRICRTLGILPVFLLACVVAWMTTGAAGWVSGILAFVFTLTCAVLSLRAGCQIAFPELPSRESPPYADPELFAPIPTEVQLESISPGHLFDDDLSASEGNEDLVGQNIFEPSPSETSEREPSPSEAFSIIEEHEADESHLEETSPDGADEDDFTREVERMMLNAEDPSSPEQQSDTPREFDVEDQAEEVGFAPQPASERPSALSDDPGRRLAQSLVMVGASPALSRPPSSGQPVSLRPASLNSARASGPDDLKLIRGVGSALENMLHKLGYFHFDQVAAWTPEEVRWVDENLDGFKGRVSRDHWVSQAIVLAQTHQRNPNSLNMVPNLRPTGRNDSNTS